MMQERWPPEPPRYNPQPEGRSLHAAWLFVAALSVLLLVFALIWGAQQAFPTPPG